MNVRFVNLFWRHEKPWINRKVRGVNLRLDQALLEVASPTFVLLKLYLFKGKT
jgi:hypothetical protein